MNCDVGISWFTCLIPVTIDEEANQSTECSISIKELLSIIQTLLGSLNETNRPRFEWINQRIKMIYYWFCNKLKKDLHNGNDKNKAKDIILM